MTCSMLSASMVTAMPTKKKRNPGCRRAANEGRAGAMALTSSIAKSRLRPEMGQRFLRAGRKAWFSTGSSQELHQGPRHLIGALERRDVPATRHRDEPRAGDSSGNLLSAIGGRERVLLTDQHEGRTADGGETRPRVRTRHDCVLLARECLGADFFRHCTDDLSEGLVSEMLRGQQVR